MPVKTALTVSAVVLLAAIGSSAAFAEDATPAAPAVPAAATAPAAASVPATVAPSTVKLNVELNALAPSQKGCMMTFVAENDLSQPITKISFELAFFNEKNAVDKITVLDFRDLPLGRKRVRQFDMPNVKCENVSRIIVNDTPVCEGPAAGECMKGLTTKSQLSVPFEG